MATNVLLENDTFVDLLRHFIGNGESGLSEVPGLIKSIIRDNRWQERIIEQTGQVQRFTHFEDFVTTLPLEGLGADLALIRRICAEDKEALDWIDRVTQKPDGAPDGNRNASKTTVDIINSCVSRPVGTSSAQALRRLRKQRPDLHTRVLADELTPHAAMIEAGFRERKIQIPHNPERAAAILMKNFSQVEVRQLVELLEGYLGRNLA